MAPNEMSSRSFEDCRQRQSDALSQMPILCELIGHLQEQGFAFRRNTFLFGAQHLMLQTLPLCGALNQLGLAYERMFLGGKAYSSDPATLADLAALGVQVQPSRDHDAAIAQSAHLQEDLRKLASKLNAKKALVSNSDILVLDDGGHALTGVSSWLSYPSRLVGVEQTASGFRQPGIGALSFPTVDVGACAVKRLCEPNTIADASMRIVRQLLLKQQPKTIGIIGLGYIGRALHTLIESLGFSPVVFDARTDAYPDLRAGQRARRIHEVIDRSDIIFGCTGFDITRDLKLDVDEFGLTTRDRAFISLSSGDDEFFTLKSLLLEDIEPFTYKDGSIPDISGELFGSNLTLVRLGFPINFDNSDQSVPLPEIQGTIACLVAALCQAELMKEIPGLRGRVVLDLSFQEWLYVRWRKFVSVDPDKPRWLSDEQALKFSAPRTNSTPSRLDPVFGSWTQIPVTN